MRLTQRLRIAESPGSGDNRLDPDGRVLQAEYAQVLAAASKPYSVDPKNPAIYAKLADYVTEEQKLHIEKLAEGLESQPVKRNDKIKPPSLRGLVFTPHLVRSYQRKTEGITSRDM